MCFFKDTFHYDQFLQGNTPCKMNTTSRHVLFSSAVPKYSWIHERPSSSSSSLSSHETESLLERRNSESDFVLFVWFRSILNFYCRRVYEYYVDYRFYVLGKVCQLVHFLFVYFDNICFTILLLELSENLDVFELVHLMFSNNTQCFKLKTFQGRLK